MNWTHLLRRHRVLIAILTVAGPLLYLAVGRTLELGSGTGPFQSVERVYVPRALGNDPPLLREGVLEHLLTSEEVLSKVHSDLALPGEWQSLQSRVCVSVTEQTGPRSGLLLDITCTAPTAYDSKLLARAVTTRGALRVQDLSGADLARNRESVQKMSDDAQSDLRQAKQRLAARQERRRREVNISQGDERDRLVGQRALLEQEIRDLSSFLAGKGRPGTWVTIALEGTMLGRLRESSERANRELQTLRQTYKEGSPPVDRKRAELQLASKAYKDALRVLAVSLLEERKRQLAEVQAALMGLDVRTPATETDPTELSGLREAVTTLSARYDSLLDRVHELRKQEDTLRSQTAFEVLEPAQPGTQVRGHWSPVLLQRLAQGALTGFAFSLLLAGLLELVERKRSACPPVEECLGIPVLARLPPLSGAQVRQWQKAIQTASNSPLTEREGGELFRRLVRFHNTGESEIHALARRLVDSPIRRLAVCSSWAREGRSLVCANLAVALCQLGRQVLLIDGDLAKPDLTNLFQAEELSGLRDFLAGGGFAEEFFMPVDDGQLQFAPAGTGGQAGELLEQQGARVSKFFESAGRRLVIIDTPAFSKGQDGVRIAAHADALLLVIDPRRWKPQVARDHLAELEAAGIVVFGAVVNGTLTESPACASIG